jgi:hypothetical protein
MLASHGAFSSLAEDLNSWHPHNENAPLPHILGTREAGGTVKAACQGHTWTRRQQLLEDALCRLRLPAMLAVYPKVAQEAATQQLTYEAFLLALVEQQLAQRAANRQRQRIAAVKFPAGGRPAGRATASASQQRWV